MTPAQRKAYNAQWRSNNRASIRASNKRYGDANREKLNSANKEWARKNPDKVRACNLAYVLKRRANDMGYRIAGNLRSLICKTVRRKGGRKATSGTMALVGCSVQELLSHLERQFKPGMTWQNYGLWEVDHRRPCASFDLSNTGEQRKCFHYTNLQPMWAEENRRKSNNEVDERGNKKGTR